MSDLAGHLRAAAEEDWSLQLRQDNFETADIRQVRNKLKSMMDRTALKSRTISIIRGAIVAIFESYS